MTLKGRLSVKGWMLGLMLPLLLVASARAAQVQGLYNAELLVAEQSVQVAPGLVSEALERVLVRVSGRRDVLNTPALQAGMQNPSRLIKQFSYQSTNIPRVTPDGRKVLAHRLRIEFAPELVNELLAQANIRPLGPTRPGVLVWVVEEKGGVREYLGRDADPVLEGMLGRARARGLPIFRPLLDLQDEAALPVSDAWGFFSRSVLSASQRYQADSVLVGRIYRISGGWESQWQLLWRGQTHEFEGRGDSLDAQLASAVDQAADRLFADFVGGGDMGYGEDGVMLRIDGVRDLDDYMAVTDYLRRQSPVEQLLVDSVADDALTLRLVLNGSLDQLRGVIGLDKRFEPRPQLAGEARGELHYRWDD
ncbi:DUF2066 domain-containing protein [Motiliproteus sp. SC1-56]|uniref:DUF2066 domain-containing protein n=1 Tax=Motiliproteus sp. SC1-56 TaxID=2799565 RepID=UPI001A8E8D26|nr:DUF2066 domain-containing protein [Motiliproteus sp. SC1-56]